MHMFRQWYYQKTQYELFIVAYWWKRHVRSVLVYDWERRHRRDNVYIRWCWWVRAIDPTSTLSPQRQYCSAVCSIPWILETVSIQESSDIVFKLVQTLKCVIIFRTENLCLYIKIKKYLFSNRVVFLFVSIISYKYVFVCLRCPSVESQFDDSVFFVLVLYSYQT